MKKLKYYAPYWVSALVLILGFTVYMLFFRFHPFSELPALAAELESNEFFIREDGAVMKNVGKSEAFPMAQQVESHEGNRYKVRNPEPKPLTEMLPHEYAALICDEHIFVRKDGKIFSVAYESKAAVVRASLQQVCPPSELPAEALPADLLIKGSSSHNLGVHVPLKDIAANVEGYLSVKLADGWYTIANGSAYELTADDKYEPVSKLTLTFPALHDGEYRIEVCVDGEWSYKNISLTRRGYANSYPLSENYSIIW